MTKLYLMIQKKEMEIAMPTKVTDLDEGDYHVRCFLKIDLGFGILEPQKVDYENQPKEKIMSIINSYNQVEDIDADIYPKDWRGSIWQL